MLHDKHCCVPDSYYSASLKTAMNTISKLFEIWTVCCCILQSMNQYISIFSSCI